MLVIYLLQSFFRCTIQFKFHNVNELVSLQSFFSDIPYELARELELHYQNVLYIVCKLVGFYVKAEYHTI